MFATGILGALGSAAAHHVGTTAGNFIGQAALQGYHRGNAEEVARQNKKNAVLNASGTKPADIRGTGRPVPPDPRPKPAAKPAAPTAARPAPRPSGGGGGRVSPSVSSPSVGTARVTSGTPTAAAASAPKRDDPKNESWSVNFLRSKRGLPSLSKGAKAATPSTNSKVGPLSGNFGKEIGYTPSLSIPSGGDVGSRKMTDRPFDPKADLLKKKQDKK
jgi:hypothetical protein